MTTLYHQNLEILKQNVLINEANIVLHLDDKIHKSNYELLPKDFTYTHIRMVCL